jgi:drug/metabolite transporter (DMT)-like permease
LPTLNERLRHPGIASALAAAMLFGASTPLAKLFLIDVSPWLLASLLYLGSGIGLTTFRSVRRIPKAVLPSGERMWFVGAVAAGGVIAPVFLMFGLMAMPASSASLLLNAEAVFTALLAWFAFRENVDRRIAIGMAVIVTGAIVLSWPKAMIVGEWWPSLAVLAACLAWAIDNNLTRKISLTDATWLASIKGLSAGVVNLAIALALGADLPAWPVTCAVLSVGSLAYGASLALFVVGLRHLGAARTGAYFSVAPFFGALLSIVILDEPLSVRLLIAGALMAYGVWLHLTEEHSHEHTHEATEHEHEHAHDEHHQHSHGEPVPPGTRHSHKHRHEPITHTHAHFPDAHHRHPH